jgi:hypothetical protein
METDVLDALDRFISATAKYHCYKILVQKHRFRYRKYLKKKSRESVEEYDMAKKYLVDTMINRHQKRTGVIFGSRQPMSVNEKIMVDERLGKILGESLYKKAYIDGWLFGILVSRFKLGYLEVMDLIDQAELSWKEKMENKKEKKK